MTSRLASIAAAVVLMLTASSAAFAQANIAPVSQFGIGVSTEGFQFQYAINPGLQIGLMAGLASSTMDSVSATGYAISPYVRFLLEGKVNPFLQAGYRYERLVAEMVEGANTSELYLAFGIEYFFTPNIGAFAQTSLFNFQLESTTTMTAGGQSIDVTTPSVVSFGLFRPAVGLEWYFDR